MKLGVHVADFTCPGGPAQLGAEDRRIGQRVAVELARRQRRDPPGRSLAVGALELGVALVDVKRAGERLLGRERAVAGPRQAAHERGFLASLFDVSFTSFITTKIIKVLYVLVMIVIVLAAVAFTAFAFLANPVFGLLALVIGAPLYIIITLALWRLYFEAAIVFFRIAEDIRALRERAEIG